ncbi:major facilitator superfamily domain-containing protein 1-like isoform X1 [Diorhabda sublineata]|uniref:major facilitator superfamily domain-containing protein 1-like isoform X1 n=1 Tax=Diorhabda sublineata TaxID=1163346 RepID=UPI0024E17C77|nr:major facilitator superfamily domain-containing protein 1-like isoform X1 [Diorhabda sublineata]
MEGGSNIQEIEDPPRGFINFFIHPSRAGNRFVVLFFLCFLSFGSYFCYDNPAALQSQLKTNLNISEVQFTALYSVYSWPNVVLNIVGGFLMDRVFGIRLGTNIYMGLALVGQLIFATAVYINQYWLMLIGRFVFGIGAESLTVGQNNYAVLWFKGKELNMVFGLQLSFARIGSTVNFLVMESLYSAVSNLSSDGAHVLGLVLYIAAGTCVFSMICSLCVSFLDKRAERILHRNNNASGEVVKLSDVRYFKLTFWLICIICVTFYCSIFPFIAIAKDFLMKNFGLSSEQANTACSTVYVISGIGSPILGFLIDKIGMNIFWILFGIFGTVISHLLLGFSHLNVYIPIGIMGISYSILASSLWPLVALVVPEYQLGTAYGVAGSIQNLGLALFSIFCGLIIEKFGYVAVEIFFICSLLLAAVSAVVLLFLDLMQHGNLNLTPGGRKRYEILYNHTEILINADALDTSSGEVIGSNSDFHIRNRYLSRIGAPLPSTYVIDKQGMS